MQIVFDHERFRRLEELAKRIDSEGWWRFPAEGRIQGFMGSGPHFIVGDQPSTSDWGPSHPSRRAFYDSLIEVGATNAHLTDIYKRRGTSGSLRAGLPPDFGIHLEFLKEELDIVQPPKVIALGKDAFKLLNKYIPELRAKTDWIWHFSYARRKGREEYIKYVKTIWEDFS